MEKLKNQHDKTVDELLQKAKLKRINNERMCDMARGIMPETRRMDALNCGKFLTFLHSADMQTTKLETGFFCRNRLCPGCAWRKSARDAIQISCVLQRAIDDGCALVFATLTARNVTASELAEAVTAYNTAYTQMMRRGKFKNIRGAIRKLEITYNAEQQTYHPHIHSVWMMPKNWTRRNSPAHITRRELHDAWTASLQYKYATSPKAQDIRTVNISTPEDVAEFAKYPAKSCDYLHSRFVFETFYHALHGIRLITYMRDAKKYKQMYRDGELNEYATPDETEYYIRTFWEWSQNDYALHKMDVLTEPERFGIIDTDEDVQEE